MKKLIYIADDEPNIRELIGTFLDKEGFETRLFEDGESLLAAFRSAPADLVILDIMMPGADGLEICAALRRRSDVPVIIVSAKDSEADRITGITLGSDDYVTKPFSPIELVARVNAIFRRVRLDKEGGAAAGSPARAVAGAVNGDELVYGDLTVSDKLKRAACRGKDLDFSPTEFALTAYLIKNSDRAVSREELLKNVWKFEYEIDTRATDDVIKRLRKKLTAACSCVSIETVWGFGFKLETHAQGQGR